MTSATAYEHFVEWDVRNWSLAPQFWERHTTVALPGCRALELGSRHGGLSLWLAQRGAQVLCTDLGGPSPRARHSHRSAGLHDRVCYADVDATRLPYHAEFDVVVFKSLLGALQGPDRHAAQAAAVAAMHRALRPGGELFFAENLAGTAAHRALRNCFVAWARHWRYVSITEMLGFLRPFRSVEYRTIGLIGALGRTPAQRRLLGAIDRAGLDRLVPSAWRYIIVGVARK